MKCLIILASCLMLAVTAQYPLSLNTVDPSTANDFDLNRLITQVLSQAAAIQPDFTTPLEQVSDSSAQQLSGQQNQYGVSNNGQSEPEQYAVPVLQNQEQSQNQYGAPAQTSARTDNTTPRRQSQEYRAPVRQSQEYGTPAKQSQTYAAPSRPKQQYSTPARQVQEYAALNRPTQARNEYNAASSQQNRVRNEYVTPSRQTAAKEEFALPEQQLIRELTEAEFTIPSQKSNIFSGRSQQQQQQRGGYSSSVFSSSSGAVPVRSSSNTRYSTPLSNDLNTASSGGNYYSSPQINSNLRFNSNSDGGEIKKFVYIHTAPPEPPQPPRARIQKPKPIAPDTHFNIIFIKAPVPSQEPPPEIELPLPAEQKTLVYVLLKKPEPAPELRIPVPPPTAPSKPEVYFIRYSDRKNNQQGQDEDQPSIPYDHEESELSPNILPEPVQYDVDPRNVNGGYISNVNENNDNNNVGAYSEPTRKVSSKKSSKSKSQKSSGSRSHYVSPGSRPFESQSSDSTFKPISKSSNSRNRSSGNQSSDY